MSFKTNSTFAVLALGTLGFVPTAASAATANANLGVSATVSSNCTITTSPVAFGSVNAIGGSAVDAAGGISVTCTNGTTWAASAGVGGGTGATFATRKMVSGSNVLNYSLYTDSARSTVWGDGSASSATIANTGTGATQAVTIYGRIASGQTTAPAGGYSDTVDVTITY